jgi:protein-S-isoprenylcysteine O-methyltransferase Ste14
MSRAEARLIALLLMELVLMTAVMGAVLFGAAGALDWAGGWYFLSLFTALSVAVSLWLLKADPALLEERLKPVVRTEQKPWDRVFMAFAGLGFLGWLALMGIDARMGWSHAPPLAQVAGAALLIASFVGIAWVYRENSFASPVVRIQRERGQGVVSTGPYAIVRHPMYAFALLMFIGAPLLAGSWWAIAFAPIAALGLAIRTLGEERMLKAELPGYEAYARRVRWRFAPGLW